MRSQFGKYYLAQQNDKKIAIIGAGEAAKVFVKWSGCDNYDVYTTDGGGEFLGRIINPIAELPCDEHYQQIVIASQYVDEIVPRLMSLGTGVEKLFWFDFLLTKLASITDMAYENNHQVSRLHAVYDLEVYPPNFEIAIFLARAELCRKELGLDKITLFIITGSFGGVSARGILSHGIDSAQWRIQHVLIPMAQLLPSCDQVLYVNDKSFLQNEKQNTLTYPPNISKRLEPNYFSLGPLVNGYHNGMEVRPFVAPKLAKKLATQFIDAQLSFDSFITISLREYDYQNSRNSCLSLYRKISDYAFQKGVGVVLIRDTYNALAEPMNWEGVVECPVASYDLAIRMAVYEKAILNVSVSSGPSWGLMLLSPNIDFLLTHIVDDSHKSTTAEFLRCSQGITKNQQYPFSNRTQQLCWSTESLVIIEKFKDMLNTRLSSC